MWRRNVTSDDRCQQKLRCQNSIAGCTLHYNFLGDNEYGTMTGNPRNFLDHLKDTAKADDLFKQHATFEIIDIIVQQQMLASALQEMRKARYVSVLADEVT